MQQTHLPASQQLLASLISLCSARLAAFAMAFGRYFFFSSHLASPVQMQVSMNQILHGLDGDKFTQVTF